MTSPLTRADTMLADQRAPIWTKLPEAAAILADCAARPPQKKVRPVRGLTTYHASEYVGPRVRQLNAIWKAERERLFAEAQASRDYSAFDAHCRYGVQTALADAIFFAKLDQSAEHDRAALAAFPAARSAPSLAKVA